MEEVGFRKWKTEIMRRATPKSASAHELGRQTNFHLVRRLKLVIRHVDDERRSRAHLTHEKLKH